jgi:hypothetical protein
MARERGTFNFSASLEVKKQAPLDARQTYITYEELTQQSTWVDTDGKVWLFKGLTVPVNYNGQNALFMLINPDAYTSTSSWVRVDGNAGESPIYTISDLSTLSESSVKSEIVDILGEYSDFLDAYNNNKLLLCIVDNYYHTVGSINHEGPVVGEGKFIITINSNSSGNPIITKYVIKHDKNDWLESLGVESITPQKLAVAEDLERLDNIYFLGDILTLTNESVSTIATILTPYTDFKEAVNNKKIFIAKTQCGQYYVRVSAISGNAYLINAIVSNEDIDTHILKFKAIYNGNHWDSISDLTKYSIATSDDLTRKVTRVAAAANKGIEIGGSEQTPTVGIKLDPTQGNVTLSLGTNGLKAEDTTALRDVTGQNFIKKNGTNVEGHLNLTYNTETKKINLEGFDSSIIASIDATAFIKDGMINTVELVTDPESHDPGTYLVITFNTDAGKDAIYLDVTGLIDVYQGTNGIKVTGKDIYLIIDPTSESYLSLSDNGIKIKGIDAKISEVVEQAIIEAFAWHEV